MGVNCNLLKSYLSERRQYVSINNQETASTIKYTTRGCVQGSSLSAIMFLVMINDLPKHVKNSITIMFADDSQFVISGPFEH